MIDMGSGAYEAKTEAGQSVQGSPSKPVIYLLRAGGETTGVRCAIGDRTVTRSRA